jgi:hypothetical protein
MVQDPVEDRELLRVVRAFCAITDPDARRIIIEIAEAAARGAPVLLDETGADHDPAQDSRWLDEFFRNSMS